MPETDNGAVIPVACHLNDAEFRVREAMLLDRFREAVIKTQEIPSGYSYELPFSDCSLLLLADFILLEKECCSFLSFSIQVNAGDRTVSFILSGPNGAKDLIKDLFNK